MASMVSNVAISNFPAILSTFARPSADLYKSIYDENRHRVYAFAFWMTDSEPAAEELLAATFVRAFEAHQVPTSEQIDDALIAILREEHAIGNMTLQCAEATEVVSVRNNTKRVHLELAVVQLPATEKLVFLMHDVEGYSHERIARTLGINVNDSKLGLHQARLRIRELVAKMAW